jgi:hypothetical protein
LLLHARAFRKEKKEKERLLAWLQANIMNRLRWSKSTPKVSVSQLLGEKVVIPASRDAFIQSMKDDAERAAKDSTEMDDRWPLLPLER